jgi:hypothetical protein
VSLVKKNIDGIFEGYEVEITDALASLHLEPLFVIQYIDKQDVYTVYPKRL